MTNDDYSQRLVEKLEMFFAKWGFSDQESDQAVSDISKAILDDLARSLFLGLPETGQKELNEAVAAAGTEEEKKAVFWKICNSVYSEEEYTEKYRASVAHIMADYLAAMKDEISEEQYGIAKEIFEKELS